MFSYRLILYSVINGFIILMTFEISSLEITSVKLLCLIKLVAKRYLSCKECSFLCLEDIYIYIYIYIYVHTFTLYYIL